MPRPRLPKSKRRSHDLKLVLDEHERDALDAGADRFGVDLNFYLRTLILAADSGELPIDSTLFDERS